MSEDLKRCPFCGGEAKITRPLAEGAEVCCKTCRATTWMCYPEERAIKRWNTRPEEERLKAENERLKEILKIVKGGLVYRRYLAQLEEDAQMYQWSKGLIELINAPDKNIGTKTETNGEEQVRWE